MMEKSNRQLLEDLGINIKLIKSSGKTICPKCSHTRKNKKDPCLSVNIVEGIYKCHNDCGFAGRVFNKPVYQKKEYIKPIFNNRTDLPKSIVDWFFKRGISQQTLIDFKITDGVEWMPQTGKEHTTINFNYFRNSELVNIKFRDGAKRFKLVKDAELIFYNLDSIKDVTECIICEGEIDAMSWHEAGFSHVISVPNGASKNQKMEYLDNCFDYFTNKTKIYLSTDDDIPGRELRDELSRRLGLERCHKVDFEGLKDANEYLVTKGKHLLLDRLNYSKEFPITGVFTISDVWDQIEDIYLNGLPQGDRTGDEEFDNHLRFFPGELTMITGIPGHGKSIFLDQITIGLALNSDWKFGVFSPESFPIEFYYTRLIKRLTGKKFSKHNISRDELEQVKKWTGDRYHLIFPQTEGFSLDVILEKAKKLVLRKGIKGLIIDPWNRIEATMTNGSSQTKFITEQLTKIVNFNQITGVHTFLVAHPTKMLKDEGRINYLVPNLYNISGSADFFNMTQNGFTVYRNYKEDRTEIHIQKVKWEHIGKIGLIEYKYCDVNARFFREGQDPFANWLPNIGDSAIKEFNHFSMNDREPFDDNEEPPF